MRTVIRTLFERVELIEWAGPSLGHGEPTGVLTSEENLSVTVGGRTYALVPFMRPEMVGPDFRPVKARVPEELTTST